MAGLAEDQSETVTIPYKPRSYQMEIHRALEVFRFAVLVLHRRAGKTVAMINQLVKSAAICNKPRPRFSYVAPLYSQAKQIAWDYLKYYTAPIPGVKRNESELYVELPNEGRIKLFGADNPDSMRGLYHDGVVLDEPAQMKLIVWPEVIRPALADRGGWAAFIGTPKGIDPFFELYQMALEDPAWFVQLLTVEDTGIIPMAELEAAAKVMSESQFRQEFYCDFTASSDDIFIPLPVVVPAQDRYHGPADYHGAPVILAYDIARFGDDESVGYRRQGLAAWKVREIKGADTMTVVGLIAQDINQYKPDAVFIDEGNMGAGVIDRLRQLKYVITGVNFGGKPTIAPATYINKRTEMWGQMKQWLHDGGAIPKDQRLVAQISGPMYTFDSANRVVLEKKSDMKKRGLASPDRADALALTFAFPVFKHVEGPSPASRAIDARTKERAGSYNVLDYR